MAPTGMKRDLLCRAVGHCKVFNGHSVADAAAERVPESTRVRGMGLERDDVPARANQVGQEPREDAVVRTHVCAGPARSYEPSDCRLKLGLPRPVALPEPTDKRSHRQRIVAGS